jgi:hypothetical protein
MCTQWQRCSNIPHEAALRLWFSPDLAHTTPHPNRNTVARFSLLQCSATNSRHIHSLSTVLNTRTLDPCLRCLLARLPSKLTVACTRIAYSESAIWMDCIVILQVLTMCVDVDLNKTVHTAQGNHTCSDASRMAQDSSQAFVPLPVLEAAAGGS